MPFNGRFVEDADMRRSVDRDVSNDGVCGSSSSQRVVVDGRDDDGLKGDFGDDDRGFFFSISGDSDLSDHRDVEALDGTCGVMERGFAFKSSGDVDRSSRYGRVVDGREAYCIECVRLLFFGSSGSGETFLQPCSLRGAVFRLGVGAISSKGRGGIVSREPRWAVEDRDNMDSLRRLGMDGMTGERGESGEGVQSLAVDPLSSLATTRATE